MPVPRTIQELLDRIYDNRNSGDIDAILQNFTTDCVFRIAGGAGLGTLSTPARGEENFRNTLLSLIENWDLSGLKIAHVIHDADSVFVHRTGPIRHIPSNTIFNSELADLLKLREGKIAEFTEFADTQAIAAIAVLPQP